MSIVFEGTNKAINQSTNLYVYCMNNSIRYIDVAGCKAEDKFKSRDDAAIDFAENTRLEAMAHTQYW